MLESKKSSYYLELLKVYILLWEPKTTKDLKRMKNKETKRLMKDIKID